MVDLVVDDEKAVMRLIELGLKEGLLVKGEKYPAENLEVLLGCVKVGFADYSESMELEEFCKILLEGSYTFTVEYPDAFEDCARAYLVGVERGSNLSKRNLI